MHRHQTALFLPAVARWWPAGAYPTTRWWPAGSLPPSPMSFPTSATQEPLTSSVVEKPRSLLASPTQTRSLLHSFRSSHAQDFERAPCPTTSSPTSLSSLSSEANRAAEVIPLPTPSSSVSTPPSLRTSSMSTLRPSGPASAAEVIPSPTSSSLLSTPPTLRPSAATQGPDHAYCTSVTSLASPTPSSTLLPTCIDVKWVIPCLRCGDFGTKCMLLEWPDGHRCQFCDCLLVHEPWCLHCQMHACNKCIIQHHGPQKSEIEYDSAYESEHPSSSDGEGTQAKTSAKPSRSPSPVGS